MAKNKEQTQEDSADAEIRIPLTRRIDSNQKPYYLAHLPGDVTVLVFTQCKEPCIIVKKTTKS